VTQCKALESARFPAKPSNTIPDTELSHKRHVGISQLENEMAAGTKTAWAEAPGKAATNREIARGSDRYMHRGTKGRILERDDLTRALTADRLRKVPTVANPGQGDRGDRR
jgi:hypothetical protein